MKMEKCPKCKLFQGRSSKQIAVEFIIIGIATSWIFGIGLIFLFLGLFTLFIPKYYMCKNCHYKFTIK